MSRSSYRNEFNATARIFAALRLLPRWAKMFPGPVSISQQTPPYSVERIAQGRKTFSLSVAELLASIVHGVHRRWQRECRRRAVGRAYDMALEVARLVAPHSRVLDVGCGNGFIAHHLTAMLGEPVVGIDLAKRTAAPIAYLCYDGKRLPIANQCFDTVLLCYVLHHAQDFDLIMSEVRRVLRPGGLVVVYEDIPCCWLDRVVCWIHKRQWQHRTGPCTFRLTTVWRTLFSSAGFEIVAERPLSRWRNLTHPVCRNSYVLKLNGRS